MEHAKKLDFIHKMAKLGLENVPHFAGGFAGGLGDALGVTSGFNAAGPSSQQINGSLDQSNTAIGAAQNLADLTLPGVTTGLNSQNALATQLQQMSQGLGPNPAQNQLAQATGSNVANQAALMAGQRGSGANIGLLARQNAQQGAATQQSSAGQAATLGAQQQIAAQGNLANLASQQVGQAGQAAGLFNTAAGNQLNTLENANAAANSTNAATAGQNASTNKGLLGSITGAVGGLFGLAEGGKVKKMSEGGLSSAPIQAAGPSSWIGGYLSGSPMASYQGQSDSGGDFASNLAGGEKAGKGLKQKLSGNKPVQGGPSISDQNVAMGAGPSEMNPNGGISISGQNAMMSAGPSQGTINPAWNNTVQQASTSPVLSQQVNPSTDMSVQGSIDPNETDQSISQGDTAYEAKGGNIRNMSSKGSVVKANSKSEKATKVGNNYDNDTIPAMLSEGEVVIDRATLSDPGPIGQMARAIRAHIEQRNKK